MTPGGAQGFESLFRTSGVPLTAQDTIPDLNQPLERLINSLNEREGYIQVLPLQYSLIIAILNRFSYVAFKSSPDNILSQRNLEKSLQKK